MVGIAHDLMDDPVIGTCMSMCPDSEIERRHRTNRLHRLEATKESLGQRKLEPDPQRVVKEFERTSMGCRKIDRERIRPVEVLEATVTYLVNEILTDKSLPYNLIYDFVFDRFRAVRQEMVMQQIGGSPKIRMLQKMILFHEFSAYTLCDVEYRCFDPVINRQHLSECLNSLVAEYSTQDREKEEGNDVALNGYSGDESRSVRAMFEATYLLHNMLSEKVVLYFASLPHDLASDPLIRQAIDLVAAFHTGNFFKILTALPKLPLTSLVAVFPNITAFQVYYMRNLSSAFASTSPAITVPLKYLSRVLCPFQRGRKAEDQVFTICQYFDVHVENAEVWFRKGKTTPPIIADVVRLIPLRKWPKFEKRFRQEKIWNVIAGASLTLKSESLNDPE